MSHSDPDRDQLEQLAEEFVRRYRAGDGPRIDDYAEAHPDQADAIRTLFPTLVLMEELAPSSDGRSGAGPTSSPPEPLLDQRIGDYRLVRRIGAGGMGVVYEAIQESLGRRVALKLLTTQGPEDTNARARFRREARAAAQLHHTNIVPVYEVGQTDDVCFYAMQLILGQGLDEVLGDLRRLRGLAPDRTQVSAVAQSLWTGRFQPPVLPDSPVTGLFVPGLGPPPSPLVRGDLGTTCIERSDSQGGRRHYFRAVARIARQAADALHHAHQRGIVHRDVKPSNLLLDAAGTVWVTDFGLAKANDCNDLTAAGEVVGTLRYIPPERFKGESDARGDIYSLGLTLYELLTLQSAFPQVGRHQLIEHILYDEPPRPRQIEPALPRDLETIVAKAIDKEPSRRYATAAELAEDLRRFLEDEPIRARQVGTSERIYRWGRRNPLVASLVAALLALFGTAFLVVTLLLLRANYLHGIAEDRRKDAERNEAEARRQQEQAEENFTQACAVVEDYLTRVGDSKLLEVPGLQPLRRDLLLSALRFHQAFLEKRRDEPRLQAALAAAYLRAGKIHRILGEEEQASLALEQAHELYQALLRLEPERTDLRAGLAECDMRLQRFASARAEWQRLLVADPGNDTFRRMLAETLNSLAVGLDRKKQTAEALRLHEEALKLRRRLFEKHPTDPAALSNLGGTLNNIGALLSSQGHLREALRMYRDSIEYHERAHRLAPHEIQYGTFLVVTTRNLANLQDWLNERSEALTTLQRAVSLSDRIARDHPAVPSVQVTQVETWIGLLELQRARKLVPQSDQTAHQIETLLDRLTVGNRAPELYQLARLRSRFAGQLVGRQRTNQANLALKTLQRAVFAGFRDLARLKDDTSLATLRKHPGFHILIRRIESGERDPDDPARQVASSDDIADRQRTIADLRGLADPNNPRHRARLARHLYVIGLLQTRVQRFDEARASLAEAEKLQQSMVEKNPKDAETRAALGETRVACGSLEWHARNLDRVVGYWDRGLRDLEEAIEREDAASDLRMRRARVEHTIGNLYSVLGLWQECDHHLSRAFAVAGYGRAWDFVGLGLVKRIRGDDEGYRKVCREAVGRFASSAALETTFEVGWLGVLGPNDAITPKQALARLQQGVATNPTGTWRLPWLALGHLRASPVAEARRVALEGKAKMPGYFVAQPLLAIIHHRAGETGPSRLALEEARKWFADHLERHLAGDRLALYDLDRDGHSFREFLALYREARVLLGQPDDDPWLAMLRARAHLLLGQRDRALADVAAMLRLAPRDARLWTVWGRTLSSLGEDRLVEEALARAHSIDATDVTPLLARAHYRLLRGDRTRADADLLAVARTGARRQTFLDAGWWVSGPVPADLEEPSPVERAPDLSRPLPGTTWKRLVPGDGGLVDLGVVAPGKQEVSVHALAFVASDRERTITLAFGSHAHRRLWVNGQLAHDSKSNQGLQQGFDPVRVTLRPGTNTFLVRIRCTPEGRTFHLRMDDHPLEQGRSFAERNLWPEAARALESFGQEHPRSLVAWWWHCRALALLAAGDTEGHARTVRAMMDRFGNSKHGWIVLEIALCALIGPDPIVKPEVLDRMLTHAEKRSPLYAPVLRSSRYRKGDYLGCLSGKDAPGELHLLLNAMAAHQLGRTDEARDWLSRAEAWYDQTTRKHLEARTFSLGGQWTSLAMFQILHAQARKAITPGVTTWHAQALRGRGLAEIGRHQEAQKAYGEAQERTKEPAVKRLLDEARKRAGSR